MMPFRQALHRPEPLLMDGAMGTELQRAGVPAGACYEQWNLTHPERVLAIHRAYATAGAEVLLTNSFLANPAQLARHGLEAQLEAIGAAAIRLARSAADNERWVVASVGPMPVGGHEDAFLRAVRSLAGADALLLETWSVELHEAIALAQTADANPNGLPVLVSVTYHCHSDGRILVHGTDEAPTDIAQKLQHSGIAALGVNCGRNLGPAQIAQVLAAYRGACALPLFARPNAGTPQRAPEGWQYPLTPAAFATWGPNWRHAGAHLLGGCCGTTPAFIAALRAYGKII